MLEKAGTLYLFILIHGCLAMEKILGCFKLHLYLKKGLSMKAALLLFQEVTDLESLLKETLMNLKKLKLTRVIL